MPHDCIWKTAAMRSAAGSNSSKTESASHVRGHPEPVSWMPSGLPGSPMFRPACSPVNTSLSVPPSDFSTNHAGALSTKQDSRSAFRFWESTRLSPRDAIFRTVRAQRCSMRRNETFEPCWWSMLRLALPNSASASVPELESRRSRWIRSKPALRPQPSLHALHPFEDRVCNAGIRGIR